MVTCDYCGKEFEGDNEELCPECTQREEVGDIKKCDRCGGYFDGTELTGVGDEEWCSDCLHSEAFRCDGCGRYYSTEEINDDNFGTCVCDSCYGEYNRCEDCGRIIYCDDTYWRGDYAYCEDCYPGDEDDDEDLEDGAVHYYSYRPAPAFATAPNEDSRVFLGVELEVGGLSSRNDCIAASYEVDELGSGRLYLKSDVSIPRYGFEVVSHPATIGYHKNFNWEDILQYMSRKGLRSHDISSCGLHVHISRDALPASKWIIVDWFINRYEDFWVGVARRRNNDYAAFKDLSEVKMGRASLRSICGCGYDRYKAVNFCNRSTVELRLFKGSLRYKTFIGTLELVDGLVKWAGQVKVSSILHDGAVKSFTDFLEANDYEYAVEYLKYRHLL